MLELNAGEGSVTVSGVVVEGAGVDVGAGSFGDLYGVVGGV